MGINDEAAMFTWLSRFAQKCHASSNIHSLYSFHDHNNYLWLLWNVKAFAYQMPRLASIKIENYNSDWSSFSLDGVFAATIRWYVVRIHCFRVPRGLIHFWLLDVFIRVLPILKIVSSNMGRLIFEIFLSSCWPFIWLTVIILFLKYFESPAIPVWT